SPVNPVPLRKAKAESAAAPRPAMSTGRGPIRSATRPRNTSATRTPPAYIANSTVIVRSSKPRRRCSAGYRGVGNVVPIIVAVRAAATAQKPDGRPARRSPTKTRLSGEPTFCRTDCFDRHDRYHRSLELRQLEHFVAVADERHFTRAAAKVHLAQSSLSGSIAALERELGTELLVRSSRKVELTEAGRALLPAAHRSLEAARDGQDAVAAVRGVLRGRLRVGTIQALGGIPLTRWLADFHERHPEVHL